MIIILHYTKCRVKNIYGGSVRIGDNFIEILPEKPKVSTSFNLMKMQCMINNLVEKIYTSIFIT